MKNNPLVQLFDDVRASTSDDLTRSEFAARYFLNPRIPRALKSDPDGSFHFAQQITDAESNPITGLIKDQPIPLYLRWYQAEVIDDPSRYRVLRMGRRTGKSFLLAVIAAVEALRDPSAKILILTPNESHIKVLFEDYIRPLFAAYRHKKSAQIGIPNEPSGQVPPDCDFIITTDTKKPQEIRITNGRGHDVTIRGMVIGTAARGQSASMVIFDEADYADTEQVRGVVAPITMTMSATKIVMSSTPTGRRDSFYYEACHDSAWRHFHQTFEVLPHYDQALHDQMVKFSGGASTNTFQQEYLADFGGQMEGVFDQKALNRAFIVSPYSRILEETNESTRERLPRLADTSTSVDAKTIAYYEGVQPQDWRRGRGAAGSESIYRPEYRGHGVITAGTDWNDVAGMQTVVIWWPPEEWLRQGRIQVSRYDYDRNEPITTRRSKDERGRTRIYRVGHDNGTPGGAHDLSHVKGIVIWHGRLESGHFNWQSAANRVVGILSIPDFIDTWYVDQGYGSQVNKLIEGIMNSGQYIPDMNLLNRARDIDQKLLRQIRQFHPEADPERTGKLYRTIRFGDPYTHRDIDFKARKDLYKDVMVGLARRMVAGRELLLPFGELVGFHDQADLGRHYSEELDTKTGERIERAELETDTDLIELNGADPARGERSFGGLITQMREWRVENYNPTTGRPRYAGADHAIDAFMLALLAYHENFSDAADSNIFRKSLKTEVGLADDLFGDAELYTRSRTTTDRPKTERKGDFTYQNYSDEKTPIRLMQSGTKRPEDVGTSLGEMLKQAGQHFKRRKLPPST